MAKRVGSRSKTTAKKSAAKKKKAATKRAPGRKTAGKKRAAKKKPAAKKAKKKSKPKTSATGSRRSAVAGVEVVTARNFSAPAALMTATDAEIDAAIVSVLDGGSMKREDIRTGVEAELAKTGKTATKESINGRIRKKTVKASSDGRLKLK